MTFSDYPHIKTDEDLMETVSHGSYAYPFRFYDEKMSMFDFHTIDWHWHAEFEFVYVAEGEVNISIGTDTFTLRKQQGLFINSRELHYFHSDGDAIIPNFLFADTFTGPIESLIYQKYTAPITASQLTHMIFDESIPWQAGILSLMRSVIAMQRDLPDEMETFTAVCSLISGISKHIPKAAGVPSNGQTASSKARLQLMLTYIQDHYADSVSLNDIAYSASVSKSTALNLFKKYLHTTPVDYLVSYRLKRSTALLSSTEKKIGAISSDVGFANTDYFCRSFKNHYHMTPLQYRHLHS